MRDVELYKAILGLTPPWTVSDVTLDVKGQRVTVRVRTVIWASLNGRRPQLLIDPRVNLAAQPRTLLPAPWIMPLTEPLPPRTDKRKSPSERGESPVPD